MKLTQEKAETVHYRGKFSCVDFIVGYRIIRLRTKYARIATYVCTILIPESTKKLTAVDKCPYLTSNFQQQIFKVIKSIHNIIIR